MSHYLLGEGKQKRGVTTVAISVTSHFVVCKSLDSEFYAVNKSPSIYSPFGSKYGVKLMFEENTFDVNRHAAVLEFKVCNSK